MTKAFSSPFTFLDDRKHKMERKYQSLRAIVGNSDPSLAAPNISEKICLMNTAARRIYLNTFCFDPDMPISSILKKPQIIDAFLDAKKPSNAGEKAIAKALRVGIAIGYEKPAEFASAIVEYLLKRPELTSIIANLIFPSLFGFFVFDQQASRGFDVVEELVSAVDVEFSKPFIRSFLTSAVEFAEQFWSEFFDILEVNGRQKPSMMCLKEIILAAFNTSAKYLPPHHSQICITAILRDPRVFCECFFSGFLLESFESLKRTGVLTYAELKKAFAYMISTPDFDSEVQNALTQQAFSFREEIINSSGKYVILMSPYEIDILLDMLSSYEPLSGMVTKINNSAELSTSPLLISMSLFGGIDDQMSILGNPEPVDVANEDEIRELIDRLQSAADELPDLSDPVDLVIGAKQSQTFSKKRFLKYFPKLNKEEVSGVLSVSYNDLVQRTVDWENVLRECQLADDVESCYHVFCSYVLKSEFRIFAHLSPSQEVWPEAYARSKLKVDPNWFSMMKHRAAFEQILGEVQSPDSAFEKIVTERESLLYDLRKAILQLVRESLGQRLYTLHSLITNLATLAGSASDTVPYLLCYVLKKCPENGFFETFVNLRQCEQQQKEDFELINSTVRATWESIRDFVNEQIEKNETLKAAIETFATAPRKVVNPIASGSVTVMSMSSPSKK